MHGWPNSSESCAICRLEWRPSWWSLGACALLALLAIVSLWLAALPEWLALLAALAVVVCAGRRLRAEWWAAELRLTIPWNPAKPVRVDEVAVESFEVEWRGPLALLCWRFHGGARVARLWWPDLLPPALRRELRLAVSARAVSPDGAQVAP